MIIKTIDKYEKYGFKFTHIEHREHTSIFKEEPVDINWYEIRKL